MITFTKLQEFANGFDLNALNQNFAKLRTALLGDKQRVTLAFPLIAAGGVQNLNLSNSNAAVGDGVSVSPLTITAGVVYYGTVLTNGTIQITAQNCTAGGITPPSGDYVVTLIK